MLISRLNPQIPRVTFIPPDAGRGLCSAEFAVLEPVGTESAKLTLAMRSDDVTDYLSSVARGTSSSRRRVDDAQVLDARVDLVRIDSAIVNAFQDALRLDRKARLQLAHAFEGLRSPRRPRGSAVLVQK